MQQPVDEDRALVRDAASHFALSACYSASRFSDQALDAHTEVKTDNKAVAVLQQVII